MCVVKYSLVNNSININMETRFCIEYVNPRHPLRDNGSINVRYDRVLTLEQAEHDLMLILSFGAKILNLYMGNVVDGKTGEWSPIPMIVDKDDWFTTDWLEQNPTWSEDDERICRCLIKDQNNELDDVRKDRYGHSEIVSDLKKIYRERIKWLKSLKDRMQQTK